MSLSKAAQTKLFNKITKELADSGIAQVWALEDSMTPKSTKRASKATASGKGKAKKVASAKGKGKSVCTSCGQ